MGAGTRHRAAGDRPPGGGNPAGAGPIVRVRYERLKYSFEATVASTIFSSVTPDCSLLTQ